MKLFVPMLKRAKLRFVVILPTHRGNTAHLYLYIRKSNNFSLFYDMDKKAGKPGPANPEEVQRLIDERIAHLKAFENEYEKQHPKEEQKRLHAPRWLERLVLRFIE